MGEEIKEQRVRVKMEKKERKLVRHVSYERGNIILSRGRGEGIRFSHSVSSAFVRKGPEALLLVV